MFSDHSYNGIDSLHRVYQYVTIFICLGKTPFHRSGNEVVGEDVAIGHQGFPERVRIVEDHHEGRTSPYAEDWSVLTGQVCETLVNQPGPEPVADDGQGPWSWRQVLRTT